MLVSIVTLINEDKRAILQKTGRIELVFSVIVYLLREGNMEKIHCKEIVSKLNCK